MSLRIAMLLAHDALNAAMAPHAIIRGMALPVLGYPRATNDVDFYGSFWFSLEFSSDEVAQLLGEAPVDFLYANREASRDMLRQAIQNSQPEILLAAFTLSVF